MKFTASSADLLEALSACKGAIPSKSTMPILECILFEREGDALRLSATDLEIAIVQTAEVQFEHPEDTRSTTENGTPAAEDERIAVPAGRLLDTLRALPDLPVTITTDDDFQVTLSTDQGRYQLAGHDGEDYPALPDLEDAAHRIELESALLGRAIAKTSFAVSKDALRPAMMGVYFEIGPDGGRAVATDGHRLVKLQLEVLTAPETLDFIVPAKALKLAGRLARQEEGLCTLTVGEGHVSLAFGRARVTARLIDETYPNYEAVIPDENSKHLVAERAGLLAAAKRVGLYSSSMTNQIRLGLSDDNIKISAEDIERSSEAHETVRCEYDDEEMTIGFNAAYLNEVLSNLDADEVVFALSTPNRAAIATPQTQGDGEDLLMLIMPVMLNTYA